MQMEILLNDPPSPPHPNPPEQPSRASSPIPSSSEQLTQAGRPRRSYRIPARYEDVPPEAPVAVPLPPSLPQCAPGSLALPRVILHVRDSMRTCSNRFGILREYSHRPSYDPDAIISEKDLANYHPPPAVPNADDQLAIQPSRVPPWPFQNMTVYLLMEWMITGSSRKSVGEVDRLASDVLGSTQFNLADLAGFSARQENKHLDDSDDVPDSPYSFDGWVESEVQISIPTGLKDDGGEGRVFSVPGLHHRSLLSVMKAALTDVTARRFHFSPFKRLWESVTGSVERCYDEAYTSDAWIDAHDTLQKQHNEPGCKLEKVILGLMFWSDSTHLAAFGTAKAWPLYLYFGNLSKYFRGKPGSGACHHVAYIPSVSSIYVRYLIDSI
jgi:Plavaka transposase